jgi:anti-sigma-K factor RskA
MSDDNDCHGDAAAYVLGALEDQESAAFRQHMAGCAVCRDEVTALEAVVNALPMAAPQMEAPARLRRRLMTDVRADAKRRGTGSEGWRARTRLSLPALRGGRPALAAGALLAAAALAFGVVELSSGGSAQPRVIQASVLGVSGRATVRLSGGHAELTVEHIPAPPQGRIYQVWLQRGGERPSPTSALFSVTSSGAGTVDVPGNLHGVRTVLVTAEPLGGSKVPTRAPFIVAQLT